MPIYDFKCVRCGATKEVSFPSFEASEHTSVWCDENEECVPAVHNAVCMMVRQVSASAFSVKGFSAANGYAKEGE